MLASASGIIEPSWARPIVTVSAPGKPLKRLSTVRFSWMMMTTCLMCVLTSDSKDEPPASGDGAAVQVEAFAAWQVPAVPPPGVTTQRARRRQPGPLSASQAEPSPMAAWQVPAAPPLALQVPLAAQNAV